MGKISFTPGPWTIVEYGDEDVPALVIHKDSESRICFMATPGSLGDPAKIEADARLIAAAPDLLSLVKRFVALPSLAWHPERHAADEIELMQDARAVIAKAEGRTL